MLVNLLFLLLVISLVVDVLGTLYIIWFDRYMEICAKITFTSVFLGLLIAIILVCLV